MKQEDVKIGMKVVPHDKTVANWDTFEEWLKRDINCRLGLKDYKEKGYCIVGKVDRNCYEFKDPNIFLLGNDFFAASDFDPYIEPAISPTTPKRKFRGYIQGNEVVVHFGGKTGKAKYNPEDEKLGLPFSINKGVDIALRRTLGEDVQDIEIIVNPQPKTEDKPLTFEVGDWVNINLNFKGDTRGIPYDKITKASKKSHKIESLNNYRWKSVRFDDASMYFWPADMLEKVPQVKFVPHLESESGLCNFGNTGEPAGFTDVVGQPLFIGDAVQEYKNGQKYNEKLAPIIKGCPNSEGPRVMGYCAGWENGKHLDASIVKVRSYSDIPNGEVIDGVKYVKEP